MTFLNLSQKVLNQLGDKTGNSENTLQFLGFSLNLQTGNLQDILQQNLASPELKDPTMHTQLTEVLIKYASTDKHDRVNKLVNFKDFSGGYAYENAFTRRVVEPIAKLFGNCPLNLVTASELLNGKVLEHGDCSIEIEALPGIPLTFILWTADEEEALPPSAKVLFDESANKFLNVEDLSWLSDLTVWRLSIAQRLLKNKQTLKS
ncbi:MAG: DUF3786 domain-containing protein [Candidatus Bathyarchaeota archaeon]|nr:DUF3786 domain-containing protein [Candidatus Termiticorpusculum sp.]